MKYITINNINIPINQIINIINTNNEVILVDSSRERYIVFTGDKEACNEFFNSLLTTFEWTEKVSFPEVHWVDVDNNNVDLLLGMAIIPNVKYDGKYVSDFTLQSSEQNNVKIANTIMLGIKVGKSNVTVTKESKTETINVNVVNGQLKLLFEDNVVLTKNAKYQLKFKDNYGYDVSTSPMSFMSLNPDKATVDGNGVLSGVDEGEATIIAEYFGNYYFKTVTVLPERPNIEKTSLTLKVDETSQQSSTTENFSNQEWISDNQDVATVNSSGLITAKSVGTCKIISKFKEPYEIISKEISVTVNPKAPTPDEQSKTIKVDETFTGDMPTKAGFSGEKWVSDSTELATVDQSSGLVTAKKHGSTKIRGKFTKPYETDGIVYTLTIQPKEPQVVTESQEIQVEGTLNGALPSVDGFSGQSWESTDPTKASVVEGTGIITGVAEGSCEIKGYFTTPYKALAKKYTITVTPKAIQQQTYNTFVWR